MYLRTKDTVPAYRPGLDRKSAYKNVWLRHWRDLRSIYPERFAHHYGELTSEKCFEVSKLLSCGDYRNGFRKHECPECGTVMMVPFTCKSRLCLSCYRKKLYGWSMGLSHILHTTLTHFHVTFTLPGPVTKILFEKDFPCEEMITTAAGVYWKELLKSAGKRGREWQSGGIATVHRCGNSLNYNPHVHLIGTRELVNTTTGEILRSPLLNYRRIRFTWMNAALRLFRKYGIFTEEEVRDIRERYKNGFHVHLQPIIGTNNEVLFRTAEYLATGYIHNSMITRVDHDNKKITFRYKSWVDRNTKEKTYSEMTMDIYEFMARMLFYLPDKHRKAIRYYGIYAHGIKYKLDRITRNTWAKAIQSSFDTNPKLCPDCGAQMIESVVFAYFADREWRKLWKTHLLVGGYFRMKRGP
ncbi:MAG: IS91 family transposase [Chrysiogenales bacterium]|nr:MAG: IS91 family transposase [Chrysiogenales bacterium]